MKIASFFLLLPAVAFALDNVSVETLKSPSPFRFTAILDGTTNLMGPSDSEYDASSNLWLMPSYEFAKDQIVRAKVIGTKGYTNKTKSDITHAEVGLTQTNQRLSRALVLSERESFLIPASSEQRGDQMMTLGVKAGPRLDWNLGTL